MFDKSKIGVLDVGFISSGASMDITIPGAGCVRRNLPRVLSPHNNVEVINSDTYRYCNWLGVLALRLSLWRLRLRFLQGPID